MLAKAWIEHNYNPFIVFDNNGKILSLTQEAHYLLDEGHPKKYLIMKKPRLSQGQL